MPIDTFSAAMSEAMREAGGPQLLVAALSGGMDSVVLLHLLTEWRKTNAEAAGVRIVAAHLNHGIRDQEARRDADFSRAFAAGLDVPYVERSVDTVLHARQHSLGVEAAGRALRYRFFHDILSESPDQPGLVLTGHHADDQAETILLHLRRGAHRRGMSGMRRFSLLPLTSEVRVPVARPLLPLGREVLHAYALLHGLDWCEDSTNLETSYARNKLRHRIIPMLEKILPGFRNRLLEKAAILAREEEDLLAHGQALASASSGRENGGRIFRLTPEAMEWPERLNYALRHVVEEEMGSLLPHGAALAELARLAESGRLGETVCLPGLLRVRRESDGLFFFFPDRDEDGDQERERGDSEIILPDPPFDITAGGLFVSAAWLPSGGMPPEADRADRKVEWFNAAAIRWPLRLRAPFPGERMRPMGAPGSRKIHDILMDVKAPRRKRDSLCILADHAGAIWLWPYRIAQRTRLAGQADKALRVEIREVGSG